MKTWINTEDGWRYAYVDTPYISVGYIQPTSKWSATFYKAVVIDHPMESQSSTFLTLEAAMMYVELLSP